LPAGTYTRLCNLGIRASIVDSKQPKLHTHIDQVAQGRNHNILSDYAECNDLVTASDAREGHEVTDEKGCHYEWVGHGASFLINTACGTLLFGLCNSQCSGALEGPIACWAEWIGSVSRDAHGEAGERSNAWTLIVRSEERSHCVTNREDAIRVTDANSRSSGDFHGTSSEVQGLDETATQTLEELIGDDLCGDGLTVDKVSDDLSQISMCVE
jgi:hypothetical protein